jgi:hypothetical protein
MKYLRRRLRIEETSTERSKDKCKDMRAQQQRSALSPDSDCRTHSVLAVAVPDSEDCTGSDSDSGFGSGSVDTGGQDVWVTIEIQNTVRLR